MKNAEDFPLSLAATTSKEGELVIQKSTPLLSLWRSDLTLPEFKILDAYLARINSHDPRRRKVCFEKGELETLLDVEEIKPAVLKKRLKNLGVGVEIEDPTMPEGFLTIFLFEHIKGGLDENGLWKIELQCTEAARKYIFNVENIGYLRYRLREIVCLKSRYSYILFLYLEKNKFRGSWEISFDELRKLLKCETVELYKSYYRFNDKVLKRAQKELQARNGYMFHYTPIKTGRKVTAVRFTVPCTIHTEDILFAESIQESSDSMDMNPREFVMSACTMANGQPAFSEVQQKQILAVMQMIPYSCFPSHGMAALDIETRQYAYLRERFLELERRMEMGNIRNPFAYFLKLLKADAKMFEHQDYST